MKEDLNTTHDKTLIKVCALESWDCRKISYARVEHDTRKDNHTK